MADKKTATKKKPDTLQEQILAKQLDLLDAKKSLAAGELQNPRAIKNIKKDIARLLTKLNAQEPNSVKSAKKEGE